MKSIFVSSFIFLAMVTAPAVWADSVDMGCYIDTPDYQFETPGLCFQQGSEKTKATYVVIGDYEPSRQRVVWLTTCGPPFVDEGSCTIDIRPGTSIQVNAIVIDRTNGDETDVSATAIYEFEPPGGDF